MYYNISLFSFLSLLISEICENFSRYTMAQKRTVDCSYLNYKTASKNPLEEIGCYMCTFDNLWGTRPRTLDRHSVLVMTVKFFDLQSQANPNPYRTARNSSYQLLGTEHVSAVQFTGIVSCQNWTPSRLDPWVHIWHQNWTGGPFSMDGVRPHLQRWTPIEDWTHLWLLSTKSIRLCALAYTLNRQCSI